MWDKYTISDEEWLEKYGNKLYYNSYLDKDKNDYLKTTTVTECLICGGRLSRKFSSQTCGHGESIQSITYICEQCCYDDVEYYGMGTPMFSCDARYKSKVKALVDIIIKKYKEKEINENLH